MKYLAVAVLLCGLLPLCDAYCYRWSLKADARECQDNKDKTWHAVGSSWRNSACEDCTCGECCAAFSIPRNFPEDCVSVFDSEACEYKVHKRDDPTVECPIYGAVGK